MYNKREEVAGKEHSEEEKMTEVNGCEEANAEPVSYTRTKTSTEESKNAKTTRVKEA